MIAIFKMCQIICQNKNNIQNFLSSISKCLFFFYQGFAKKNEYIAAQGMIHTKRRIN